MSSRAPILALAAAAVVCATALSGCLTPRVKPALSQAVVQARAGAGQKPAACPPGALAAAPPVDVGFGFDDATVSEVGRQRLAAAARWLTCNPKAQVVIAPNADRHGDAAHQTDLASRRAQAVIAELRAQGARDAVIQTLARDVPDPVTAPHLLITATGRGW